MEHPYSIPPLLSSLATHCICPSQPSIKSGGKHQGLPETELPITRACLALPHGDALATPAHLILLKSPSWKPLVFAVSFSLVLSVWLPYVALSKMLLTFQYKPAHNLMLTGLTLMFR